MGDQIGGIILAGGKSSRMGKDKGLIEFQGKQLIQYAIGLLHPLCTEIIISTNQAAYEEFGLKTVADVYRDCGPLGGLQAALSETEFEWNVVVSCDTPFLQAELFTSLLQMKTGFDAVIPKHAGGIEPMAGVYHKSLAESIEAKLKAKDFKTQKFLYESNTAFYDATGLIQKYPRLFYNLNRPEELDELAD
ncbi:molybdenum cofactor guanylyltransferase [Mangrovibacterium lignilyticum]|uniref:molybdenum cofactor guanylyltransferase n=1 Tax=Mangrovibacterium lignilyticum TaxID=2668052 RepID=UPI0013D8B840|nr:molybdenum cofactor guanylyltransferase [Mangrovibacterium lignilyticum]